MESTGTVSGETPSQANSKIDFKVWQCILCGYIYDEAEGSPAEGLPPGTRWADVPDTWVCPQCSATKADFEMVEI